MASLMVNTSSKNSSRSGSPSRAPSTSQLHQQPSTVSLDHTSRLRNVSISQAGEGSTGSGSSGGGGGTGSSFSMKSSSRQRSPGNLIRMGDAMDESSNITNTAEPEEFVPNIHPPTDDEGEQYHATQSFLSNGSSELIADDVDSSAARVRQAIEHIQSKIAKTRELIRIEQTTRDENVNEYLKLAANADKQQLTRIKTVFEKKNQKSAHNISQLQKKLDSYMKKLRNYEMNGAPTSHRQPREMLRDMGQGLKHVGGNIRDGITGFSGTVMSKPREFAHLIKNKFGSADNINTLSHGSTFYVNDTPHAGNGDNASVEEDKTHHGSATLPGGCSLGSTQSAAAMKFPSEEGSECSSVTSESGPGSRGQPHACHSNNAALSLKSIFAELQEHREHIDQMREKLDSVKTLQQEVTYLSHSLQEERFRCERLEEQINDLTELHQNEVENLKQTITDMEEKVQYQSEDRLRDIHEMLESCQTKICKMEHQQQQHQQYVTLEGLDNSNARALVVKLINVVLTVLQVVLLLVATGAGIMMPFLRTSCTKPHCFMCRVRILTTTLVVLGIVFVLKQWPEVHDVGSHLIRHLKQTLAMK
ncbi:transmembrane and coiled-coil domains protein 2 isoform X1 [Cataglyphis hispanica]|uniref:transmembrane and coiled-coil domains protein 2 isoform X1 n=1 Tax=Cataglyphis hispanica TaxID=1086592 RepID=UPI00217F4D83|nr:transmembrane and coiled-coil domains protein 2 isoform X1 [Cataglyphis hispanica]XP_050464395.1 transmembrane and coiled-coil domains protein 2 isoform X1 [Cataglyphis hispanica]XP_050464396.1 transmembrane and coiled-coil domains protein 2 isoform X1 [Cataglyphis hispanica]XP_050464398.1 transmembrane and coiled-coil domains protein 2 isoform X1 [Cataglyphis hispanica]XP_050464399.1 transmembrane and coiled-coil domains protein 2 isoform X1 [Cataglyphis hispanica]XP_050464400.1 transmembr